MLRRSLSVLCAAGLLGSCASPSRQPAAPAALLIAVDRSGNPDAALREQLRQSCVAALKELRPDDLGAVLAFDSRADYVVAFSKTPFTVDEIPGAGGASSFRAALTEIRRGFRSCKAVRKHAIIFSSGESKPEPLEALQQNLFDDGITVSSVCWSSKQFDAVIMNQLAAVGRGRFKFTNSPENLPKLAAMEARTFLRD